VGYCSDKESPAATIERDLSTASASGFTPIELLMAITLLAIVVATLVPQMLSTSEQSKQNSMLLRLHLVRGRIEQFRDSHQGHLPAEGRNSAAEFLADLARLAGNSETNEFSRSVSEAASTNHPEIEFPPVNPYTQRSDILVIPDRLRPHHFSGNGRHGWAYSSTTGEFRANLSPQTTDSSGRLINQL
jgi:general secretion pathway protein G